MAKVTGVGSQMSGKVGQIIYRQTKYGTVAYEAKAKSSVPQRTEGQMQIRTQWSNLAAVYKQFNSTLKKGFEGLNGQMSDYNAFIQANTNVVRVYVPKQMRLNGGSVLAPYQITRGSLPSIAISKNGDGVLVSDISVGSLAIGDSTTVAEFSAAVIAFNEGWQNGDQITFFYGQQSVDAVTGIPRARISGWKVVLDTTDAMPLNEVAGSIGFASVQGSGSSGYVLGMSQAISDGAAVWVHSRDASGSELKVSTQYMYVDSSVVAQFQGDGAFGSAADSYGGINTSAVYLQPGRGNTGTTGSGSTGSGQSGNSGGNGSSGNTGDTGGGTTGGNTGGNGQTGENGNTEGETTVSAPVFSGETQFTESTQVTMTGPDGATIYYTTDGTTPTSASSVYSETITLTATTTVKAIAIKDGVSSEVTSRIYTKSSNDDGMGQD